LQVLLHESNELPLVKERGFKVSPGFVTQVAATAEYVSKQTLLPKHINGTISKLPEYLSA